MRTIIVIDTQPPAFIFIAGAILLPFLRERRLRRVFQLLIPVIAFIDLLYMPEGTYWIYNFLGYDLILGKVDKLSMCFGYVFVIMAFLGMVYALHVRDTGQHVAAFLYMGSTLGVTFAGDIFTLFVFWEIMAISSVFLIWYQRDMAALAAGFRYIMVHIFGGCSLLAGIIIYVSNTGSTHFGFIEYGGLASQLMLLGFIINAAVPPFHAWLSDAYPEATVTGSVFLTAFTTKSAVYVLLRAFPGVELLVWLGAIMAIYGVVYAVLENDIRRLLAYHIISQVGYMVCGVGLGTEMAMNGTTAHAFSHILYKALLFMGVGAVIQVTGRRKLTELQGRNLYKQMPICLSLYMIGAFSISAVPLFNGFVSKTMVVAAAGELHRPIIHLLLHLASIGTFLHTGLKLPYGTWFGRVPEGEKVEEIEASEPPLNMLVAMGMAAFLCIFTGIYPKILYNILPYPVHYHPYTTSNVVAMMQLLLLTAGAFWLYIDKLGGEATISVDTDWFYRKPGMLFLWFVSHPLQNLRVGLQHLLSRTVANVASLSKNPILLPEIAIRYIHLRIINRFYHIFGLAEDKVEELKELESRYDAIRKITYDKDVYRRPIGLGVLLAIVLLFLYGLVYFFTSR
ncbi:MAG: Na(+)/H(+) antiporter subunit D [Deltaproteobacteria bacterium]|nr:Na(+)/H(+) antiporter subunit D [Deltaproteobacteria bacterium]MBW2340833.1 Na(+)/H(+) antiporter subunit D [Deltaproteobacteria bacterium]